MPVCSPYAVFRAADLGWSPAPAPARVMAAATAPPPARVPVKIAPAQGPSAVIQGELFGHSPTSRARRRGKSMLRREETRLIAVPAIALA